MSELEEAPFAMPLGREIDLHTFRPQDVGSAVEEYLGEARRLGFRQVRIVHGRGIGLQRETVRRVLANTKFVEAFGDDSDGNWGATWARLKAEP